MACIQYKDKFSKNAQIANIVGQFIKQRKMIYNYDIPQMS
jgi:hypothetical protein